MSNVESHNIVGQIKQTDDIEEQSCERLLFQADRFVQDSIVV